MAGKFVSGARRRQRMGGWDENGGSTTPFVFYPPFPPFPPFPPLLCILLLLPLLLLFLSEPHAVRCDGAGLWGERLRRRRLARATRRRLSRGISRTTRVRRTLRLH